MPLPEVLASDSVIRDTRTDHFDGRRFFNPNGANGQPVWKAPRMFLTPRARWPMSIPVEPQQPPSVEGKQVAITYIGHATFLIQAAGTAFLTDPVYADRASPFQFAGPRRVRAPGIRFNDLPPISIVLLSHNHYDHCDLGTLVQVEHRFKPTFLTPLGNGRLLQSVGIRAVEELDWWQAASRAGFPITLTPAQHFSARWISDRNRALWGGFLMELAGKRILFAGDSGYGPHFGEMRRRLGPIDLALLPIGAYEPRWFMKDIHMNPEEAVQAHLDLAARASIAMHFGVFQLTPEAIDEPPTRLVRALASHGIPPTDFRVVTVGESVII
ncbi:MAG TPA: MBL fold metallo-hydrolase [bacterium]|nr:MBL fold metallo-hydrolase [bacterium]